MTRLLLAQVVCASIAGVSLAAEPALKVPRNRMFSGSPTLVMAVSPDGKLMAATGFEKVVRVWDLASGKEKVTFRGHTQNVFAIAFSADSKFVASGGYDKAIKVWDVATGEERLELKCEDAWFAALAFHPDGKTLFSAAGNNASAIRVWDLTKKAEKATLKGAGGAWEGSAPSRWFRRGRSWSWSRVRG